MCWPVWLVTQAIGVKEQRYAWGLAGQPHPAPPLCFVHSAIHKSPLRLIMFRIGYYEVRSNNLFALVAEPAKYFHQQANAKNLKQWNL
jgi:hypothetical protein